MAQQIGFKCTAIIQMVGQYIAILFDYDISAISFIVTVPFFCRHHTKRY